MAGKAQGLSSSLANLSTRVSSLPSSANGGQPRPSRVSLPGSNSNVTHLQVRMGALEGQLNEVMVKMSPD